ncbi:aldo/keto reductase [Elysia marginata]|uniref:Aldo/keto reductase n=1 Tax=Elysia marginata TaxID=1093978 RepID=A0AAV4IYU4_9GAST|nr:aldo/keto reductase [Elysia marginata]
MILTSQKDLDLFRDIAENRDEWRTFIAEIRRGAAEAVRQTMERITLKGTDLKVSPICLGTWQFNDSAQTITSTWPPQTAEDSKAIVDKCLELGINFFDTAEAYDNSEKVLGKALEGRRQDVVVASKFGFRKGSETSPYSAQQIDEAITRSLINLQTNYLDILQIHYPRFVKDTNETIAELERQKSLGRIRYYGLSNYGPKNIKKFMEAGGKPVVNQIGYNLLWRSPEHAMIPDSRKYGINLLAYSPLQQGLLTGKFSQLSNVPEGRRRGKLFSKDSTPLAIHGQDGCEKEVDEALKKLSEICKSANIPMSTAALSWILQQDGIEVAIVGASSPQQIVENCKIVQLQNDVLRQMTEATEAVKQKALKKLSEICKSANIPMSTAALSWMLQQGDIQVVIVGASSPQQIVENCKIVQLQNDVLGQMTEATEAVKQKVGLSLDQWSPIDSFE